jgi:hypothetical protein
MALSRVLGLGLAGVLAGAPPVSAERFAAAVTEKPCEELGDVLIGALASPDKELASRAEAVVGRCGKRVAKDLVKASEDPDAAPRAVPLLARVSPELARELLPTRLGTGDAKARATVRSALAHALDRAPDPAAAWLQFATKPNTDAANFDATRTLLGHLKDAGTAGKTRLFAGLSGDDDARYLLLPGLAELATAGDEEARNKLNSLLREAPEPWIRERAAALCANVLCEGLVAAVADNNPRVRATALASLHGGFNPTGRAALASPALAKLATDDPFPFVQVGAVDLLASAGPSDAVDQALLAALGARSTRVRGTAAQAFATRFSSGIAETATASTRLRARVGDENEDGSVRGAAASALGNACDHEAIGVLRRTAIDGALPLATEAQIEAAKAAALALGHFSDEGARKELAAIKDPNVRADLRQAAGMGLAMKPVCR